MNKKLFTAKEAKDRQKLACRIHMRKKRSKSKTDAAEIVLEHKKSFATDRDKRKNEIELRELAERQQSWLERQTLINLQEKLFKDNGSKLEKQEQLQSDLVHWLEMNPISNPSFWKVYEKLRECEVRIMALTKGHQYGGGSGGLKEFSTFNLKTAN